MTTRNDAKRREMTCGYARGVDGVNTTFVGCAGHTCCRDRGHLELSRPASATRCGRHLEESGTYLTRASAIERRTRLGEDDVQRALRRLNSQPSFFEKVDASGGLVIMVGPPTADALRVAGAWPSPENQLRRLISALEEAAEDGARAPEERSKFRQAASYLGSFATQVAIGALGGAGGNVISG